MEATELRELQAPLKDRYRAEPADAVVTLRAEGRLGNTGLTCKVETGRALVTAGLHPASGGTGMEACSGDMLLEALVACAGVTLTTVATAIGVDVRDATVHAEGDLDFRGTLGVTREAPVGFRAIRLHYDIDSDEPRERIGRLLELTERFCVVFQTLNTRPELSVDATLTPASD
ncbi:OsmC family protein [Allosalinactinospora lopnorensis]|uniref:OsmC family protein n=1 Tax=Allosalinactinospora lopnorensis TaxID=1352348 RepID=UPI000623D685|nr:OsmC family protein [Allosalinactinospora lopnorensis]